MGFILTAFAFLILYLILNFYLIFSFIAISFDMYMLL